MFEWGEIRPDGAGVIATIIPVFLLAGLLDVEALHLFASAAPKGKRLRDRALRVLAVLGVGFVVYTIVRGLVVACQGIALGITLRGADARSVWLALAVTIAYLLVMVMNRLRERGRLDELDHARRDLARVEAEMAKLNKERDHHYADGQFQMAALNIEATAEVAKQLAEVNRQLSTLREELGESRQHPLPARRRRRFAWPWRNGPQG